MSLVLWMSLFAPLRGTSLLEDGLHEATDTVFTHNYINTSMQFELPLGTLPSYI
jgi:hypothetical protein